MKVLWIASWFPTPYSPFNGDFIERMGKAVAPFCDIYLLHVGEGPIDKTEATIEMDVFERVIVTVPFSSKWNYFLRFFRLWMGFQKGIKLAKNRFGEFDIVHLHVIYTLGIFYLVSKSLRKIPLVVTEHWAGLSNLYRKSLRVDHRLIVAMCIKRAKVVLPVSYSLANDMQSLGFKGRYEIVPNVIDLEIFTPLNSEKPSNSPFNFIVLASLFDEIKNISGIIRAFKYITLEFPEAILTIVGGGNDDAKLKLLVNSLEISDRVFFLGEVSHSSVAQLMQKSDALIVFSRVETFSCVIIEAMAVGLPVITSNCGGITSSISKKEGIVIESEDENGLTNAMKRMIVNYDSFEPGVRRDNVYKFSYNFVGQKLMEIYEKYSKN